MKTAGAFLIGIVMLMFVGIPCFIGGFIWGMVVKAFASGMSQFDDFNDFVSK